MTGSGFRKRAMDRAMMVFVGYVLALLLVRAFESRIVFLPNYEGRLSGEWQPAGLPVEDVWVTAADGVRLHAWWIPGAGAKLTFLAFHGNAGNIANRASIYEFLRETPGNVLAVEYRGYGKSEGKPGEAGIYRDAEAAYEYLVKDRNIAPRSIVSFGQSLGTAVAAHLAAKREVGGLILEAPFPSGAEVARRLFWFLPGLSWLVHGQFETGERLKEIRVPVMVVHCDKDPVIPLAMGRQVFALAHPPKYFLEIDSLCHEESALFAPTKYRTVLHEFLATINNGPGR